MKCLEKDVALIARPDHSYFIYERLLKSGFSFVYITFKLCPDWLAKVFKTKKIRSVKKNYSISYLMTFHNIAIYNFGWKWPERINPDYLYTRHIRKLLQKENYKLLHYWPDYCIDYVAEYKNTHHQTRTIADIYFPCAETIINEMNPVLKEYGLNDNLSEMKLKINKDRHIMEMEDSFLVPSPYVANTYKAIFPDKKFYVVSYGIGKWEGYQKKEIPHEIKRFVYVGTISVEKGCDLLCEWFKMHSNYEVHLIGKLHPMEKAIFSKYCEISNIFFEGVIPKSEIQRKVTEYDCGIHLSRFDAYGLAVAEMISAGLPVIVSDHSGISFEVENNSLGEVVSLDFERINGAVRKIVDNYSLYLENIDTFIRNDHYDYGTEVVKLYKSLTNG